ncbi:MAG: protein kinase [Polyangiaceae bacterium]
MTAQDVFGIVGKVIAGTYQVECVVAEGGFGVVYRAYHGGFRAPVALKCLKTPHKLSAAHQAEFLEQFRAEAELLFRLSASIPTVVRPLHVDAVTLDSGLFVPFMALEWLEGETLEAIMEHRRDNGLPPVSLRKLIRMLTPVARALERAHNFMGPDGPISVVHRDLKPENIFVARVAGEEVVKILDFGIGKAKSVASQVVGRESQTQSALSSFTPAYGAPEQWVPKRYGQTGPWTDVWGLALTMVELSVGRTVIDGDHAAMMGTALDANRRPTPRNEGLEVSDEVELVFRRALAVDPRDRYPDAGKFWNALCAAVGVRGDGADEFNLRGRDARAEAGHVPTEEHLEAAVRFSSRPPSQPAPRREAETLAADGDIAAPRLPTSAAVPELVLGDAPPVSRPRVASGPAMPPVVGELDLDDEMPAMDLALDLAPGERPAQRSPASAPNWSRPSEPGPVRRSSGANHVAVHDSLEFDLEQAPASGRMRVGSGEHPLTAGAVGADPRREDPLSSPQWAPPSAPGTSESPRWSRPEPVLADPEPSLARRLAPGIVLLCASIILTIVDQTYAGSSGEVLTLGPVRATWLAGFLMLSGLAALGLAMTRHFRH